VPAQAIFKKTPHDKQVMMFSATLSSEIRPVCKKFMRDVRGTAACTASCAASCCRRRCCRLGPGPGGQGPSVALLVQQ
jgi:hypothetical protein